MLSSVMRKIQIKNSPMKKYLWHTICVLTLFGCLNLPNVAGQSFEFIPAADTLTLREAHVGNEEIDIRLMDSYIPPPQNIRQFYIDSRRILADSSFQGDPRPVLAAIANNHQLKIIGGPMLGNLDHQGVSLWLRTSGITPVEIRLFLENKLVNFRSISPHHPGQPQKIRFDSLQSNTPYQYHITSGEELLAEGSFRTTGLPGDRDLTRIIFGSCFHKIGLHNPNLVNHILFRKPEAMLLLGDIAVDDRENHLNLHHADYLLRDISPAWSRLAANAPLYATWDDHDYLNNDLSGIPEGFTEQDRKALREIWSEHWNNPPNDKAGIYFNTRLGPAEIIMLDTRSCRTNEKRGQYGSYLGIEQMDWLKKVLRNSTALFKVISSGTMWSDDISNGKDSWGTWDTLGREELFSYIEKEKISGVILLSGDRHGARALKIPRESGFAFYEFEAATLGGVPGPPAMANDPSNQLFGYPGFQTIAFGELTFDTRNEDPVLLFRLIDEKGNTLEEHRFSYDQLRPR